MLENGLTLNFLISYFNNEQNHGKLEVLVQ